MDSENIPGLVMGGVVALVLLIAGFFLISPLLPLVPQSQLKDYTYSLNSNLTELSLNATLNQSHLHYIDTYSISGETPTGEYVSISLSNVYPENRIVYVYSGTTLLGNTTAIKSNDGATPTVTTATLPVSGLVDGTYNLSFVDGGAA